MFSSTGALPTMGRALRAIIIIIIIIIIITIIIIIIVISNEIINQMVQPVRPPSWRLHWSLLLVPI